MKLTESVGIRLLEKSISCQQMISAICDFTPICLVLMSDDGKKEIDLTENVRIELLEKSDRDPNSSCPLTFLQNCVNTIVGVRG